MDAVSNHIDLALSKVILQFRDSPEFLGLVGALVAEVQALEDAFQQILSTSRSVTAASGATLDSIAKLVGSPVRGVRSDTNFRSTISAAIVRNASFGRVEDMIAIAQASLASFWDSPLAIDAGESVTSPTGAVGGFGVLLLENTSAPTPPVAPPALDTVLEAVGFARSITPAGFRTIVLSVVSPASGANVFGFDGAGASLDSGLFYSAFDRA